MTNIEPLRNLQLTNFEYQNSNINSTNTIIQDWTPLYNSRSTLLTFKYAKDAIGSSDVYNEDFSFLMSFPNITTVEIGVATHKSNVNEIQGFKYLLSWFYLKNIQATLRFNNSVVYQTGTHSSALLTESVNAAQILKDFRPTDDCDIGYQNNFELYLLDSATQNADGSVTAKLPQYINHGGKIYPIEWVSMSSFITATCRDGSGNVISKSETQTEDEVYTIL